MTKPGLFIQSSDYASIGSDGWPTVSLTIPNSVSIPTGNTVTYSQDVTVSGEFNGKGIRANVSFSKGAGYYYGTTHYILETASSPGGAEYYILINIRRISQTVLRIEASIFNDLFPTTTMITNATGGTITAEVRTTVLA